MTTSRVVLTPRISHITRKTEDKPELASRVVEMRIPGGAKELHEVISIQDLQLMLDSI